MLVRCISPQHRAANERVNSLCAHVLQMVQHSDVLGSQNWKDISSLASLDAKQLLTRYASVHTLERPYPHWDPAADIELGDFLPLQLPAGLFAFHAPPIPL